MNPYDMATGSVLTILLWCFWQGLKYYLTPVILWYFQHFADNPTHVDVWAEHDKDAPDDWMIWRCMAPPEKGDHPKRKELNRRVVALSGPHAEDPWIRKVAAEWLKNNG